MPKIRSKVRLQQQLIFPKTESKTDQLDKIYFYIHVLCPNRQDCTEVHQSSSTPGVVVYVDWGLMDIY